MASSKKIEYLVRGATLRCSCGTHSRKLNLPESHGSYVKFKPMMNKNDCIAQSGPKDTESGKNIMTFGACDNPKNNHPTAVYEVVKYSKDGKEIKSSETGKECHPIITEKWNKCKENMFVGDAPAITTESYLICEYGGIIRVETSGQEIQETIQSAT